MMQQEGAALMVPCDKQVYQNSRYGSLYKREADACKKDAEASGEMEFYNFPCAAAELCMTNAHRVHGRVLRQRFII